MQNGIDGDKHAHKLLQNEKFLHFLAVEFVESAFSSIFARFYTIDKQISENNFAFTLATFLWFTSSMCLDKNQEPITKGNGKIAGKEERRQRQAENETGGNGHNNNSPIKVSVGSEHFFEHLWKWFTCSLFSLLICTFDLFLCARTRPNGLTVLWHFFDVSPNLVDFFVRFWEKANDFQWFLFRFSIRCTLTSPNGFYWLSVKFVSPE